MKKTILTLSILGFFTLAFGFSTQAQTTRETKTFAALIDQYEQSINQADTVLASKLWSHSQEVSFIHPRGTEYGWSGVKNVYKMFADTFSSRNLRGSAEKVTRYGEVAWLTFEWVFDANLQANGQKLQTKGRETQLWRKSRGQWRLVHIHYSGLPVTGQGQGF